jgi:hypothetical protein
MYVTTCYGLRIRIHAGAKEQFYAPTWGKNAALPGDATRCVMYM